MTLSKNSGILSNLQDVALSRHQKNLSFESKNYVHGPRSVQSNPTVQNVLFYELNSLDVIKEFKSLSIIESTKETELWTNQTTTFQQQETFWRHRSRITWLREGDANTSFSMQWQTVSQQKSHPSHLLFRELDQRRFQYWLGIGICNFFYDQFWSKRKFLFRGKLVTFLYAQGPCGSKYPRSTFLLS